MISMEAREVLKEAQDYTEKLYNGNLRIIKALREQQVAQAYQLIGYMAEGVEWLLEVFKLTQDLQKEQINLQEMNEVWGAIVEAMEAEDYALLADVLEFEFLDKVNEWYSKLDLTLQDGEAC